LVLGVYVAMALIQRVLLQRIVASTPQLPQSAHLDQCFHREMDLEQQKLTV
jgi:hypothetical protein